jgi:hypothetical protein
VFRCEHLELVDLRVLDEQFVRSAHQLLGVLPVEVGLLALLVREGVEDTEGGLAQPEREPVVVYASSSAIGSADSRNASTSSTFSGLASGRAWSAWLDSATHANRRTASR